MIEVDRMMIEKFGIQLKQMMENAGKNLAELSRQLLGGSVSQKRIAILCGSGNNGGGGMVTARHLSNWGAEIELNLLSHPDQLKDIPAHQFRILKSIGISEKQVIDLDDVDLVIDAIIGYGLTGNPQGTAAEWIGRINASSRRVLAVDTPSGLNTTTGVPGDPCIRATATMIPAIFIHSPIIKF